MGSESSSSCWEVRPVCSTSGIVGLVIVGPLCPFHLLFGLFFLQVLPSCGFLWVVKAVEEGGGGCLNKGVQSR